MTRIRFRMLLAGVLLAMSSGASGQGVLSLSELTLPQNQLSDGCVLPQSDTIQQAGNRIQFGAWAGLPMTSNPWAGTARSTVSAIRSRIVIPPRLPDGPPPSKREMERLRLSTADDVEEAYAAIYRDREATVAVYAVKFHHLPVPVAPPARPAQREIRIERDRVVVVVSGADGACFNAVADHVKRVAQ